MPQRLTFVRKILKRLDRLDRAEVENVLLRAVRENGLYEEILDRLQEGVVILDGAGAVRYANRQASVWLGLADGARPKLAESPADPELSDFIVTHLAKLKERAVGDVRVLRPREMTLRVFLMPLEASEEGDVLALLAEVPKPAGEDAFSPIRALASLAAGIAHEIGNPLNSIAIHLQLLRRGAKTLPAAKRGPLEKALEVISGETQRLDRIVKNFLRATRRPPLRFQLEDLNRIVQDAIEVLRPELAGRSVGVQWSPDPGLPRFLVDAGRLHQVIMNLLKNAMEAMPGGGKLSVAVSHRERVAVLTVKDTGQGIAEQDLPHIFEAYYTTKEEGSGLGLMTVLSGVREHGGRIEVASKPGRGTTFTILLPIRQPSLQLPQYKSK